MEFKTRENSSPVGKVKVFFNAERSDFDQYFKAWSDIILEMQSCAIFYDTNSEFDDKMKKDIAEMPIMAVVVTNKFLNDERAMAITKFAKEKEIHIIPFLEDDCAEQFNKDIGYYQCVDEKNQIQWREELEKLLETLAGNDELTEKIRREFAKSIFISYRKKDKDTARELISIIRENEACRDTAIWYDEFLVPGENFDKSIRDNIINCNLYAMCTTQNMLCECYASAEEYPLACSENKTILPILMDETVKQDEFNQWYSGGHTLCSHDNRPELFNRLNEALGVSELNNDPRHCFYIGLGYERGICTPRDKEKALELIRYAYANSCAEAALYFFNHFLQYDYHSNEFTIECIDNCLKFARENYYRDKTEQNAIIYIIAIIDYGIYYRKFSVKSEKIFEAFESSEDDVMEMIVLFNNEKLKVKIDSYLSEYFDIVKEFYEDTQKMENLARVRYELARSYNCNARIMAECLQDKYIVLKFTNGDLDEMENYLRKALDCIEDDDSLAGRELQANLLQSLWYCEREKKSKDAIKSIRRAKEIFEDIVKEYPNQFYENKCFLTACYNLGRQYRIDGDYENARKELQSIIDKTKKHLSFANRFIKDFQQLYVLSYDELGMMSYELAEYEYAKEEFLCILKEFDPVYYDSLTIVDLEIIASAYEYLALCFEKTDGEDSLKCIRYRSAYSDFCYFYLYPREPYRADEIISVSTKLQDKFYKDLEFDEWAIYVSEICLMYNSEMLRSEFSAVSCFKYIKYAALYIWRGQIPYISSPTIAVQDSETGGFVKMLSILVCIGRFLYPDPELDEIAEFLLRNYDEYSEMSSLIVLSDMDDVIKNIKNIYKALIPIYKSNIIHCLKHRVNNLQLNYKSAGECGDSSEEYWATEIARLSQFILTAEPTTKNKIIYANSICNQGAYYIKRDEYALALPYYAYATELYRGIYNESKSVELLSETLGCISFCSECLYHLNDFNNLREYAEEYLNDLPITLDHILSKQSTLIQMLNIYGSYTRCLEKINDEGCKWYAAINTLYAELIQGEDQINVFAKLAQAYYNLYLHESRRSLGLSLSAAYCAMYFKIETYKSKLDDESCLDAAFLMMVYSSVLIQASGSKEDLENAARLLRNAYKIFKDLQIKYPEDPGISENIKTAENYLAFLDKKFS